MATIKELETKIEGAIQERLAEGWAIRPGGWVDYTHKKCCPLGAVIIPQVSPDGLTSMNVIDLEIDLAAESLDVTQGELASFIDGFDATGVLAGDPARRATRLLGSKLREKYWPA